MLFNSVEFLLFFPVVLLIYYILPGKAKKYFVVAASYYFYMSWNAFYALFILGSTLATYFCGRWIEYCRMEEAEKRQKYSVSFGKKKALIVCLVFNLGLLGIFKYADFFLDAVDTALRAVRFPGVEGRLQLLLPVGISFYTFQAVGYVADVYRGEIRAEKNLCRYALFVSFFPQLVAGPIERSATLLGQLERMDRERLWNYEGIVRGYFLMLYGFWLKLVLADRLCLLADEAFRSLRSRDSLFLLLGAVCFSVQIYCDFAGYSLIAIGSARMMGVKLTDNFHAPYFAESIRDFWNRWHISLSTWFRDYFYIPLGGNRRGSFMTCRNLLLTFLVSGLWHGAGWNYILWGLLHGIFQVAERTVSGTEKGAAGPKLFRRIWTFVLVTFAWIFFRAASVREALEYLKGILLHGKQIPWQNIPQLFDGIYTRRDFLAIALALLSLIVAGILYERRKESPDSFLLRLPLPLRFAVLIGLFFGVVFLGEYGQGGFTQPFVYFQF